MIGGMERGEDELEFVRAELVVYHLPNYFIRGHCN